MTTPTPAAPDWLHEAAYRVANGDTDLYGIASGFALIGWEAGHLAARQHIRNDLLQVFGLATRHIQHRRHPNDTGRSAARQHTLRRRHAKTTTRLNPKDYMR